MSNSQVAMRLGNNTFPRHLLDSPATKRRKALNRSTRNAKKSRMKSNFKLKGKMGHSGKKTFVNRSAPRKGGKRRKTRRKY
jgi:hypothetical protein